MDPIFVSGSRAWSVWTLYAHDILHLIRYTHTNIASFFFVFVYVHIELYYSSYKSPGVLVWSIGVLIFG